jgi:tRNA nucleotidyltransferase (CCA-adding enzyme)
MVRGAECGVAAGATPGDASVGFPTVRNPAPRTPHLAMKFPSRLPIPPEVLKIAQRLEDAGFETWCVGGAVRDNLLGLDNHDFDLTTAAPPPEIQRVFKRTIPVGIEHGTVAVLDAHNQPHEVTTFRKDIKTDGRHAVVEFGVSLMDDLARRDFTINAIAYHPIRHDWQDPFAGAADLDSGVIRSVGDPNWRFQEDYLRILRALRFSARFEFRIQARTLEAAKANVAGLSQLSAERVREEWFKGLMQAQKASRLVHLWVETGAARIWLPELGGAGSGERGAVDKLPRDPVLITAYLASDPPSLLTRLKCSNKDIERGRAIREWRDKYPDPKHLPAVRQWLSAVGDYTGDLLALLPATAPRSPLPVVVQAIRDARDPLALKDLAVTGDDLLAAGVRPGPDVGETLTKLLGEVLEDPTRNTKEYLLSRV